MSGKLIPNLGATNFADWTSYTVTVTSGTGSFTSVSGTGKFIRINKLCVVRFVVTITTNGTAATNIKINLPFASAAGSVGVTREVASTGVLGQVEVSGSDAYLTTTTNTYPGANSRTFNGIVSYEVA